MSVQCTKAKMESSTVLEGEVWGDISEIPKASDFPDYDFIDNFQGVLCIHHWNELLPPTPQESVMFCFDKGGLGSTLWKFDFGKMKEEVGGDLFQAMLECLKFWEAKYTEAGHFIDSIACERLQPLTRRHLEYFALVDLHIGTQRHTTKYKVHQWGSIESFHFSMLREFCRHCPDIPVCDPSPYFDR